jgi:hypothetical protein
MFGTCRVNVLVPHPTAVTQKLTQLGSDFHLVVGVEVTLCSVGELHRAHLGQGTAVVGARLAYHPCFDPLPGIVPFTVLAEEVAGKAVSEVNRPHAEHLAGWGGHA